MSWPLRLSHTQAAFPSIVTIREPLKSHLELNRLELPPEWFWLATLVGADGHTAETLAKATSDVHTPIGFLIKTLMVTPTSQTAKRF